MCEAMGAIEVKMDCRMCRLRLSRERRDSPVMELLSVCGYRVLCTYQAFAWLLP